MIATTFLEKTKSDCHYFPRIDEVIATTFPGLMRKVNVMHGLFLSGWMFATLMLYNIMAKKSVALVLYADRVAEDMVAKNDMTLMGNICPFLIRTSANWAAFAVVTIVIGTLVDVMAEIVFKSVPFFNEDKRPIYTTSERIYHHALFCYQSIFPQLASTFMGYVFTSSLDDEVVDTSIMAFPAVGTGSFFGDWIAITLAVQVVLLSADVLYWIFHYPQHKLKSMYKWTGHGYHHTFTFPLASAGPWLSFGDIVVAGVLVFTLPALFGLMSMRFLGLCNGNGLFWLKLFHCYINEMNHSDHCGKQVPTWSGCPLMPPVGFALGLHESIPMHEAHHNFSSCGFGLLGIADRLFGIVRYPKGYKKEK